MPLSSPAGRFPVYTVDATNDHRIAMMAAIASANATVPHNQSAAPSYVASHTFHTLLRTSAPLGALQKETEMPSSFG